MQALPPFPLDSLRLRGSCWLIIISVLLASCSTVDKFSFIRFGETADPVTHQPNPNAVPPLSDVLALNYASSVAGILRCKFTGARISTELISTAQVALAAFAGAGAAFHYSAETIAALGLASAGMPELSRIFNARGRAQVYQDAVRLIEEAEIEYLSLNQRPSPEFLTQNGVTLFQRVTASIHVVEKTLAGNLPTVDDMAKATERMSQGGAVPTRAGSAPLNNIPAQSFGTFKPDVIQSKRGPITRATTPPEPFLPEPIPYDKTIAGRKKQLVLNFNNLTDEECRSRLRAKDATYDPAQDQRPRETLATQILLQAGYPAPEVNPVATLAADTAGARDEAALKRLENAYATFGLLSAPKPSP